MRLIKNNIESCAIEELENLIWKCLHGAIIAPDRKSPERDSFSDVVLKKRFKDIVIRFNQNVSFEAQLEAFKSIEPFALSEIINKNQISQEMVTNFWCE
jgi:type I restriction enzyme R subunit